MGQRSRRPGGHLGLVVLLLLLLETILTTLNPLQVDSTSTTGLTSEDREATSPTMSRIREEFSRSFMQRGEAEKRQ